MNWTRLRLVVVSAALMGAFVASSGVAHAQVDRIACLGPEWYVQPPPDPWTVPEEGVLVIPAQIQSTFGDISPADSLDTVTIDVTDPDGAAVSGTISYDEGLRAVLWTPDAALDPSLTYSVHAVFDSTQLFGCTSGFVIVDETWTFTVSDMATPPLETASLGTTTLTERASPISECCTSSDPNQCLRTWPCEVCWAVDYDYLPRLELTWSGEQDPVLAPYVSYRVLRVMPDGTTAVVARYPGTSQFPVTTLVDFEMGVDPACARLIARNVLDGSETATSDACVAASDLMPIERMTPPPPPDPSTCEGGGDVDPGGDTDTATGDTMATDVPTSGDTSQVDGGLDEERVSSEEGCGCRVTSSAMHRRRSAGFAALLFAGLGALFYRRRRGG